MMQLTAFRIPNELRAEIENLARELDISYSGALRMLLMAGLDIMHSETRK